MTFIESQILPRYQAFDAAHRSEHVQHVIKESLALAKRIGADENMCYTIAAYHDLGMEGPRAVHHITSGKILVADKRLGEDQRASAAKAPRSMYGKIVAEADRELSPETVMRRAIQYGLANYPDLDKEGQYKRFLEHLTNKYSQAGYIKLWIAGSANEQRLTDLRNIINNKEQLRSEFNRLFDALV